MSGTARAVRFDRYGKHSVHPEIASLKARLAGTRPVQVQNLQSEAEQGALIDVVTLL